MPLRKIFLADNEQPVHARNRYLEGRGVYPETRGYSADRPQYDSEEYVDQLEYSVELHDEHSRHHNFDDNWNLDQHPGENLDDNADHHHNQNLNLDQNPGVGQWESAHQVTRRRSPLTMLEALVQIKMLSLIHI